MFSFVTRSVGQMARWRGLTALLAVALALQVAYQVGTSLLFKVIFDDGITARKPDVLVAAIGGLAALLVMLGLSGLLQELSVARLAGRAVNAVRQAIFDRIQAHAPSFFDQPAGGQIADRFGTDLGAFELALIRAVPNVLVQAAVMAACVVFLFLIEWRLALIAIASMATIVAAPRPFARRADAATHRVTAAASALSAMVNESVLGQMVVRLFNLQRTRRAAFDARLETLLQLGAAANFHSGMVARTTYLFTGFTQIVVVGAGAMFAYQNIITGGELIAFVGLLLAFGEAVGKLTTVMPLLMAGQQALSRLDEFLGHEPAPLQAPDAVPVATFEREIRFDHIRFSYDATRLALDDVTITIRRGESVAFVGPSGCGKSTMLSLVLRLNRPASGQVLLDGHPIDRITEASLRTLMTSVPQMPVLLSGTIADNLRLSNPSATTAALQAALERAAMAHTVEALPEGLETEVGLGGGRLSPGQRQRIAIARALLRDAPILVLDEATSALDAESESGINREILEEAGRRTIVSVTHRLTSVTGFDRICVFDQGRLVDEGRHAELVARPGLYRRLWEKQHGFAVDRDHGVVSVTPDRLRAIPFLSAASDSALQYFAEAFVFERVAAGSSIFVQGDPGDKFYLLIRGRVDVIRTDPNGATRGLATLTDGDFFGEIALLEDRPRTATIRARTDCEYLALPRRSFVAALDADPALAAVVRAAIKSRTEHG